MIVLSSSIQNYLSGLGHKTVVIGFSGGSDSTATYYLIKSFYETQGWSTDQIIIAYFNHNMRLESSEEADYIKSQYKHSLIGTYKGISTKEHDLRIARHHFFYDCLQTVHSQTLILGHNLNDRIETLMLNTERGCNIIGKINMRMIDHRKQYTILRPILENTKSEINDFCHTRRLSYIIDHTNFDSLVSKRNKVRQHIGELGSSQKQDYYNQFKKWEQEYDNIMVPIKKINLPDYFGISNLHILSKNLTIDQFAKLCKEFHIYEGMTSSRLNDYYSFLTQGTHGTKTLHGRIFACCHNHIYMYQGNTLFNIGQILSFWLSYNNAYQYHQLRLVDLEHDTYHGKSINKYLINKKIPFFLRKCVPMSTDGKVHDQLLSSLLIENFLLASKNI
ncbi:MAG TPA: tRNA lysidine(34) synthetase TilS [Candidatus Absconditabacterales bacterium]|nr:tRNA lysidine(34) synthetase TilS [Candidatus Absconditabacterales bacterium]